MIPAISKINNPVAQYKKPLNQGRENIGLFSNKDIRESYGLSDGITYNPQLHFAKEFYKPDEVFDIQYAGATRLSDGTRLIRPICLSLGKVEIEPTENKKEYKVTFITGRKNPDNYSLISTEKIMTENELLKNKKLAAGVIKSVGYNQYEMSYYDKEGNVKHYTGSKRQILSVLEENRLYL